MYEKFRFSMNGFMYFLMWSMFNLNVTCGLCPTVFNGGYIDQSCTSGMACNFYCNPGFVKSNNVLFCVKDEYWFPNPTSVCIKTVPCPAIFNNGYIQSSCSRLPGDSCNFICDTGFVKNGNQLTCGKYGMWIQDTNSICIKSITCPDEFNGGYITKLCNRRPGESCTFYCYSEFVKIGYWLTCGNNGSWIPDTNSSCIKSVEQTSSSSEPSPTGQADVGVIMTIITPFLLVTIACIIVIIAVCILVCRVIRSSVRNSQRVPGLAGAQAGAHAGVHAGATCLNLTTRRQQPNADVINSVSSFESPSYNGIYVRSFEQRISSISSSCRYYEPPPSYSEIQIATNEAPPTYKEAVRDNTNFNMYI